MRDRLARNKFILDNLPKPEIILEDKVANSNELRIAIKCSVTTKNKAIMNGDFHFACSLKKYLLRKGYNVRIDAQSDWYSENTKSDDITITLRGDSKYIPNSSQINIIWLIYGCENIEGKELDLYDHVFVASELFKQKIIDITSTPLTTLLQCSDPELFYPDTNSNLYHEPQILFVGNTRGTFRPTIKYCLEYGIPISVYGKNWSKYINDDYIKGTYISNEELYRYYSSCSILLNDHIGDMAMNGFISNRVFDASLCGTFIISDTIKGDDIFQGHLIHYNNGKHLKELIDLWLKNSEKRKHISQWMKEFVLENHTFAHRVEVIQNTINTIRKRALKV